MLKRFVKIRGFVSNLDAHEIDIFLLNAAQDLQVDMILKRMGIISGVTKELQKQQNLSVSESRAIFYSAIDEFLTMIPRIRFTAKAVLHPAFESFILKIQRT